MRNLKKIEKIAKTEELRKEKERERKKDYFSKEGKKRSWDLVMVRHLVKSKEFKYVCKVNSNLY